MANLKYIEHLKKDRKLKKVIEEVGIIKYRRDTDLYLSLLRAIVGQQLSVKAAQTIWSRFLAIYKEAYPLPELVLRTDVEMLRRAGLSYQKAGYLQNIASFAIEKTLDYKKLRSMGDEELVEYLIQIKGVGRWTVEMILMFNLGREDVFPKDDLGIQTGIKMIYRVDAPDKKRLFLSMAKLAEKWRPYRTLACMYIWKAKDAGKTSQAAGKQKTRTERSARVSKK
jgi:DNA-3-methyladenine glycosylase II